MSYCDAMPIPDTETENRPIILFDGVCNLCCATTRFVIRRDPEGVFFFAPLQSDTAQKMIHGMIDTDDVLESVLLIESDQVYRRSTALLRICRRLSRGWPLLYGLIVIPESLRDGIYRWVGRNRYRWFGQKTSCWIPGQEFNDRFL